LPQPGHFEARAARLAERAAAYFASTSAIVAGDAGELEAGTLTLVMSNVSCLG
jgi:hypothetical protein